MLGPRQCSRLDRIGKGASSCKNFGGLLCERKDGSHSECAALLSVVSYVLVDSYSTPSRTLTPGGASLR